MHDSVQALAALRQRISGMAATRPKESRRMSLGHAGIDAALEGGLECGRLHEIFAEDAGDAGSAAGFAAMLLQRLAPGTMQAWLRLEAAHKGSGGLYGPGLADLGIDPAQLVIGILPDPLSLLRVAAEMARCADLGALVIELHRTPRECDLTASRRLSLAAQVSGVTVLMLRLEAIPSASAAETRWSVKSAPAVPLAANAPGFPALDLQLLRRRGRGTGGHGVADRWQVEWDRDATRFHDAATGRGREEASAAG